MTHPGLVCHDDLMEDRQNFGFYLEMTDTAPEAYGVDRAPSVLRTRGVTQASMWRNVNRDRSDLPRALPEFSYLAVYEVGDDFTPPPADSVPADVVGAYHFVRTPRPGQGNLSGKPTIGLSLVLISPRDDAQAQELRDWGDFVHIRHIAEASVPGYTMITPYVNAQSGGHPRFMHWYEIDSDDPERVFKSMTPLVTARMGGSDHEQWRRWAHTPSLRIMYVNTFERVQVFES